MAQTEEKIVKIVDADVHTRGASVEQEGTRGALIVKDLSGESVSSIPGLGIPPSDYIEVTYSDENTEVYTYKTGGATGTITAIITCVYADGKLISVTRTNS
jgi:hypothetical protein